jgi:hypothetical protein
MNRFSMRRSRNVFGLSKPGANFLRNLSLSSYFVILNSYFVIPSGAELPFFGNSAQLRDLVFTLRYLIRASLSVNRQNLLQKVLNYGSLV